METPKDVIAHIVSELQHSAHSAVPPSLGAFLSSGRITVDSAKLEERFDAAVDIIRDGVFPCAHTQDVILTVLRGPLSLCLPHLPLAIDHTAAAHAILIHALCDPCNAHARHCLRADIPPLFLLALCAFETHLQLSGKQAPSHIMYAICKLTESIAHACAGDMDPINKARDDLYAAFDSLPTAPPKALVADALIAGRYTLIARLGQGGFGQVWKAMDTRLNKLVALKVFIDEESAKVMADHEHAMSLPFARLPYSIKPLDRCTDGALECIAFELMRGSVHDVLERRRARGAQSYLDMDTLRACAYLLLAALHELGKQNVRHCDVKPENLLFSRSMGRMVLADYGIARYLTDGGSRRMVGTTCYCAPEVLLHHPNVGHLSDVWSAGCTIFYMATGRCLISGDCKQCATPFHAAIQDIDSGIVGAPLCTRFLADCKGAHKYYHSATCKHHSVHFATHILRNFSTSVKGTLHLVHLLKRMLQPDPRYRITAENAMRHPFFRQ